MRKESSILLLLAGFLMVGSGVFIVALDYSSLRENYEVAYKSLTDGLLSSKQDDYEKLKNELLVANEYVKQSSPESVKNAFSLYSAIVAKAKDGWDIKQMAKYGMAYSLHRMGEDHLSLQHLRELQKQDIQDPVLREEVEYLLGRILLLINNEEEGKAILQKLLTQSISSDLKSRIYATFGDFYQQKKDFERAKRNYQLALKYNPENDYMHTLQKEIKKKKLQALDQEYYHKEISRRVFLKPKERKEHVAGEMGDRTPEDKHHELEGSKDSKKEKQDRYQEQEHTFNMDDLMRDYNLALGNYYKKSYLEAYNNFVSLEKQIMELLNERKITSQQRQTLYNMLDMIYYRLGELQYHKKETALARVYYERVLTNPSPDLDQPALIKLGILYFDENDFQSAYAYFKKATEFGNGGKFSNEAQEWLKETERLLKEKEKMMDN